MRPYAESSRVCHTKQNKRVLNVTQIITKNKSSLHVFSIIRVVGTMRNVVGQSCTEKAILSNKRYTSEEALAVGMVDKVVPKDKTMEETMVEMEKWVAFSSKNLN